jgi:hypothetical protein
MNVPVLEGRQHHSSSEIHDFGVVSDETGGKAVTADVHDPAIPNGDRAGPASGCVHGVDCGSSEHEIGCCRIVLVGRAGEERHQNQKTQQIHHRDTEDTEGSLTGTAHDIGYLPCGQSY